MSSDLKASEQRRRFSRVLFKASGRLECGGQWIACDVRDLSLKGALLGLPAGANGLADLRPGSACDLELHLDADEVVIRMSGTVSHLDAGNLGLTCRSIDLDSVSHLRRLVELNVGDESILQRELSALASVD